MISKQSFMVMFDCRWVSCSELRFMMAEMFHISQVKSVHDSSLSRDTQFLMLSQMVMKKAETETYIRYNIFVTIFQLLFVLKYHCAIRTILNTYITTSFKWHHSCMSSFPSRSRFWIGEGTLWWCPLFLCHFIPTAVRSCYTKYDLSHWTDVQSEINTTSRNETFQFNYSCWHWTNIFTQYTKLSFYNKRWTYFDPINIQYE